MNTQGYKNFAALCESIIFEASSSIDLFKGYSGGDAVIRKLHSEYALSHNQEYQPTDKISWSVLKDMSRGGWVLVKGQKGTGAIQQKSGSYTALASTGDDPEVVRTDRGGNVLDFFKGKIGKITQIYIGRETGAVKTKQKNRAEINKSAEKSMSNDKLLMKFKPLWAKAIQAAIADIKGMISNMIKNDAHEKAEKKLNQVRKLQQMMDVIETGGDVGSLSSNLENAISIAVAMAASHYYPDQTGAFQRSYNGRQSPERSEGMTLLLTDIAQGDTSKLGTVLAFFKRTLISG